LLVAAAVAARLAVVAVLVDTLLCLIALCQMETIL
jgi:hypothetical protein